MTQHDVGKDNDLIGRKDEQRLDRSQRRTTTSTTRFFAPSARDEKASRTSRRISLPKALRLGVPDSTSMCFQAGEIEGIQNPRYDQSCHSGLLVIVSFRHDNATRHAPFVAASAHPLLSVSLSRSLALCLCALEAPFTFPCNSNLPCCLRLPFLPFLRCFLPCRNGSLPTTINSKTHNKQAHTYTYTRIRIRTQ